MTAVRMLVICLVALSTAFVANGCGGSGSSGFNIAESAAIQRVVDEGECEEFDGLVICPADSSPQSVATPTTQPTEPPAEATSTAVATATPTQSEIDGTPQPTETVPAGIPTATGSPVGPQATPTPAGTTGPASPTTTEGFQTPAATPTPTDELSVPPSETPTTLPTNTRTPTRRATSTRTPTEEPSNSPTATVVPMMEIITNRANLDMGEALCAGIEASSCFVDFRFSAVGFDAGTAFRVASRRVGVEEAWTISAANLSASSIAGPSYAAGIQVEMTPLAAQPTTEIQIVVLGFERDPGPVPSRVFRLSDTGADLAYAVAPLRVY